MPRVPVAERTVETAPLRGGQLSPVPSRAFGNMDQAFGAAESSMVEERKKADQLAVLDGDVKNSAFKTSLMYDPDKGLLNRRGKDAFGIYDEAKAKWDKHVQETEKGLASETQRIAFRNRALSHWADMDLQLKRHIADEGRKYDDTVTESWIANERTAASLNYQDGERVKTSIATQKAVLADHAKRNGLPAEWLKLKTLEAESKTHVSVIERMLDNGQDEAAQGYYQANKDGLGADAGNIEAKLTVAVSEGKASRAVTEVWDTIGPKKDTDPVSEYAMVEAIREKLGDDEKAVKAAISDIKERAGLWNAQQRENTEANEATVWKAAEQGASIEQIRSMPEYRKLDGKTQVSIKEHIVDRTHALAGRKDEKPGDAQWSNYWQYSQPDTLNAMTENQIQNLLPKLGRKLTNDLMEKKRGMGKAETLEATIDSDLFKELADEAGLKSYKRADQLSTKEKAELGSLRTTVEAQIAAEQSTRKRKLTREEKEAVMRREIEKTVTVKAGWFGTTEKPAAVLRKEDIDKVVVPDMDRTKIKDALKKANMPVTEAEIKRVYMKKVGNAYK